MNKLLNRSLILKVQLKKKYGISPKNDIAIKCSMGRLKNTELDIALGKLESGNEQYIINKIMGTIRKLELSPRISGDKIAAEVAAKVARNIKEDSEGSLNRLAFLLSNDNNEDESRVAIAACTINSDTEDRIVSEELQLDIFVDPGSACI